MKKNIPLRKVRYLLRCISFIKVFQNWYLVPQLVLFGSRTAVLRLRSGESFQIKHFLDALIVKEIYCDNDYQIKKNSYKVMVDIGSNIGTFSILSAKLNQKAKIFSYEASPSTFKIQKNNLLLNSIKNVVSNNLAVTSKVSKMIFYTNQASGLSSLYFKGDKSTKQSVGTTTLSRIFSDNKIKTIDFLKMDCEGAEYEIVLKSPDKVLKRIKCMATEYHDSITKHSHQELIEKLKHLGFKTVITQHPLETDIGIIYAHQKIRS